MWHVHHEGVVQDEELESSRAQMLDLLHLVVPVVHKPLIVQRSGIQPREQHVRLLHVCDEALHLRHNHAGGRGEPLSRNVHVGANQVLLDVAAIRTQTVDQIRLVFGKGVECARGEERRAEAQQHAGGVGEAVIEEQRAVEEERGNDHGGGGRRLHGGREFHQLIVEVHYG